MSTKPVALQEQAIIVIGSGTDAPGFKLVPDGHGGFKVVPLPGWGIEQFADLSAALKVLASAGRIKQPEASKAILTAANKITSQGISYLTGGQAAGNTVIVVG
jgi:hypothetical protein